MSAHTGINAVHRAGMFAACGVFAIGTLGLAGATIGSITEFSPAAATSVLASVTSVDLSASTSTCSDAGDVYRLAEPGKYSAFATAASGAPLVEVRGLDGEVLATSRSSVVKPSMVDLQTAARFDVGPPRFFNVQSSVLIRVRHDGTPYELVVVRVDGGEKWSGFDIHPQVEAVARESDSCVMGIDTETLGIRTDSASVATNARQVLRITSPQPAACTTGRQPYTAIAVEVFGCRHAPRYTPAERTPAEMIIAPIRGL